MTSEEIRFLASHIRDGQQDATNQIIAALRGSYLGPPADDPDSEGVEQRPSHPRRGRAPEKDKAVKFRSPFENELSVSRRFRELPPLIYFQRKIREHLADELGQKMNPRNTVTLEDIDDFDPSIGECCTPNTFRLYLVGTACDVWNKSATRVLVNSFLGVHQEYDGQNEVVREMVMNKCTAVVKSVIRQYKKRRKNPTEATRMMERQKKNRAECKRTVRR